MRSNETSASIMHTAGSGSSLVMVPTEITSPTVSVVYCFRKLDSRNARKSGKIAK